MRRGIARWGVAPAAVAALVVLCAQEPDAAANANSGPCRRSSDCDGYGSCFAASCGHCDSDSACNGHGICRSGGCNACRANADCLTGTCSDGRCGACSATAECKGNGKCSGGQCGGCDSDADCPPKEGICLGGRCSRYVP